MLKTGEKLFGAGVVVYFKNNMFTPLSSIHGPVFINLKNVTLLTFSFDARDGGKQTTCLYAIGKEEPIAEVYETPEQINALMYPAIK